MQLIKRVVHWDIVLLCWVLGQRRRPLLTPIAKVVSHSGDGHIQVVCIITAGLSSNSIANAFAYSLCYLFALERLIYFVLKNVSRRERPQSRFPYVAILITASDRFSFPSGHTSAAFLLAISITAIMPILGLIFLLWAGCIGLSRIYLGVHYPSDVLAGVGLGLAVHSLN